MIYFDNAATTHDKPISVKEAVNNALIKYSANPGRSGHVLSSDCSEMIYNTRNKVAEFFNAKSYENVVFTLNCTMALNIVIRGLFEKGDHILISDLEHNSVSRPVNDLKEKGVEFNVFKVEENNENTLKNIKKLIKNNTKAIICTHGSNVFGIKLPIKEIGLLCKEFKLKFIVDSAQTAGVVPIDIQDMNIDYLCIAPHKGLYAPMGTGILITDNKPNPLVSGGTGTHSIVQKQPTFLPDKYESGTVNVPGIAGIGAGVDFVNQNIKEIFAKENNIIKYIYNNLKNKDEVILYNNPELPVLSFNIKSKESSEVSSFLNDNNIYVRSGLHCAPLAHKKFGTIEKGTVRISMSCFNDLSQADIFLEVLDKFI